MNNTELKIALEYATPLNTQCARESDLNGRRLKFTLFTVSFAVVAWNCSLPFFDVLTHTHTHIRTHTRAHSAYTRHGFGVRFSFSRFVRARAYVYVRCY